MSAPIYNETFAGVPIPDAVLDAFVRVVAIAVQGLQNRTPRRPLTMDDVKSRIIAHAWGNPNAPSFAVELLRPAILTLRGQSETYFEYKDLFPSDKYGWRITTASWEKKEISQKEVEKIVAVALTPPFSVQHVSDASLALARKLVTEAIRAEE